MDRRRRHTSWVRTAVLCGVLGVVAAGSGVAAGTAGGGGVITACRHRVTGLVRIVSTASACQRNEIEVTWNERGVPGLQGEQGQPGEQGPQGPQGEQGVPGAPGAAIDDITDLAGIGCDTGRPDDEVVAVRVAPTGAITLHCTPVASGVKINELFLFGEDPYLELYSVGDTAVDTSGWQAVFADRQGTTTAVPVDLDVIGPGEFVVLGIADVPLDLLGGGVRLEGEDGLAVDAVGWELDAIKFGQAPVGFYELHPVTGPLSYQSMGRIPDGTDTDDNAVDVAVDLPPTPGAPNSQ